MVKGVQNPKPPTQAPAPSAYWGTYKAAEVARAKQKRTQASMPVASRDEGTATTGKMTKKRRKTFTATTSDP